LTNYSNVADFRNVENFYNYIDKTCLSFPSPTQWNIFWFWVIILVHYSIERHCCGYGK